MRRSWHIWAAFFACALVAVAAVGWLSYRTIESDRADALAATRAAQEELARLALWRLDSAAATLLAQENSQPYFAYESFYSVGDLGPPGSGKAAKTSGARLLPSPLLITTDSRVRLHFELNSAGDLHSPKVPAPQLEDQVVPAYLSAELMTEQRRELDEFSRLIPARQLLAAADLPIASRYPAVANRPAPNPPPLDVPRQAEDATEQQAAQVAQVPVRQTANQQALSANEFQARTQFDTQIANQVFAPRGVEMSVMKPLWLNGQLLLLRRVSLARGELVQGAWVDWPTVRRQLEATISDLLPGAQLGPVAAGSIVTQVYSHRMAVLPVALNVGRAPLHVGPSAPVRWGLWIIWASVALAIGAIALLLKGVLTLSERRAAFVSAVTHELRTPLTTLRMYAEMLADGMVPEEAARSEYLETLRREADRLTHLVENVLAYAQLERGSLPTKIEPIRVGELLKHARDRLTLRAAQGNFKLRLVASRDDLNETVLADPAAVERILFNLVDNACKYADAASERTLELSVARQSGRLLFKLRDHGPGLSDRERKRLFQPFRKSARDAANSAPGIGLGLALSRRLARQLDGELALEDGAAQGACFVLNLPLASEN